MIKGLMAVYPDRGEPQKISWSAHYTRWVRLLNSHPNIEMDFCGLSDKTDFTFLRDYDFVYLYILPTKKHGEYWWYEIPVVTRPYCKKTILQIDYEGFMPHLPPFIKAMINNNVDVLGYNSPSGMNWDVDIPKYPLMILQPVEELEKKIREKFGILPITKDDSMGVLWHAGTGCNIKHSVNIIQQFPFRTKKLFTSWLGMVGDWKGEILNIRGSSWKSFLFMDYNDFLKELSKCGVVLEDNENYVGFSRLTYECATLRIPVVGSTNSLGCLIAYPFTTTNPQNAQLQTQLIKRLFNEPDFYSMVTQYAYDTMKDYFSDERCMERFTDVLKELGFNV